jgi:hypothetical protein
MWPPLKRVQGWLMVLALALATLAGVFYRGRANGKAAERQELDARLRMQASAARKEVRDVQRETARLDDGAIADELKREWVRGAGGKGGR